MSTSLIALIIFCCSIHTSHASEQNSSKVPKAQQPSYALLTTAYNAVHENLKAEDGAAKDELLTQLEETYGWLNTQQPKRPKSFISHVRAFTKLTPLVLPQLKPDTCQSLADLAKATQLLTHKLQRKRSAIIGGIMAGTASIALLVACILLSKSSHHAGAFNGNKKANWEKACIDLDLAGTLTQKHSHETTLSGSPAAGQSDHTPLSIDTSASTGPIHEKQMAVKAAIERCLSSLSSQENSKIYLNINLLRCARELRINLDTCRFTFEDKYDVPIISSIIYKYAEKIRMQDVSSNPPNGLISLSTSQKDDLVGLLGEAIKGGANLTTIDAAGYTALHYVAKWISNKDITSMMVNANRSTLDANHNGNFVTPLAQAIAAGNEIVAEELIKLGADLTIESLGCLPIDTAIVYQASDSIISAIARNQTGFRAYKNRYELTPLLWAISVGFFEQANVLLMWSDQTITEDQQFLFMYMCVIGCSPYQVWLGDNRNQAFEDEKALNKLKFCVDHLDDQKSFKEAIRFFMTELKKTESTADAALQSRNAAAQRRLGKFFQDCPDYKPTD